MFTKRQSRYTQSFKPLSKEDIPFNLLGLAQVPGSHSVLWMLVVKKFEQPNSIF